MLPFIVIWDASSIRIKSLISNFARVLTMNFIPDWESEIVNQSANKFVKKINNIRQKWEIFRKKRISQKAFFHGIRNPV